jgi:hypothetical protein
MNPKSVPKYLYEMLLARVRGNCVATARNQISLEQHILPLGEQQVHALSFILYT